MKYILILLCVLILASCNEDDASGNVRLRLENISELDFDAVYVSTTGPEKAFGALDKGEISEFIEFDGIYRYAYVRIEVNNAEFILQPIDYVGETLLTSGEYTYMLDIIDESDPWSVTLEFRKD